MQLIDRAVRRVLELKFRLGLFEHRYVDLARAKLVMHSSQHQQPALDAAREGIVPLKSERNLLPLKKDLKAIAVIGPNADSGSNLLGDYSPQVVPQHLNTVVDGIKSKVSPATCIVYAKGCAINDQDKSGFQRAVQAVRGADVAVVPIIKCARLNLYGSLSDKTLPQAFEFQSTMEMNLIEVRIREVFSQLMRNSNVD